MSRTTNIFKCTKMSTRYAPSIINETRKLSHKDNDWKLPGSGDVTTRTRGGGNGRPRSFSSAVFVATSTMSTSVVNDIPDVDSSDDSDEGEQAEEEAEEEAEEQEEVDNVVEEEVSVDDEEVEEENVVHDKSKKPTASRVLLEVDLLQDFVKEHCHCLHCHGPVELSIDTVCLASSLRLTCSDCELDFESKSPSKRDHGRPDNRVKSDDFAVNVLFVVGFLSCGDGGAEAARMLGLLGLPNDTTMETRSFPLIEERIGPAIRVLGEEIIHENL